MGSGDWGNGWWVGRVVEGRDVQVNEFAFVVFHVCCGFGRFGEERYLIASALIEAEHVEAKIWCVVSLSVLASLAPALSTSTGIRPYLRTDIRGDFSYCSPTNVGIEP